MTVGVVVLLDLGVRIGGGNLQEEKMSFPAGLDNGPKQLVDRYWNPLVVPCDEFRQFLECCHRHLPSRNRDDRRLGRTCIGDIIAHTGNPIDEEFLVLLVVEVGGSVRHCGIA